MADQTGASAAPVAPTVDLAKRLVIHLSSLKCNPRVVHRERVVGRKKRVSAEMLMLVPAIIVLVSITLYPFLWMMYLSFHEFPLIITRTPKFIGVDNWLRMFTDPDIRHYWEVTVKYVGTALALEMILGLGAAVLVSYITFGRELVTTALLIPMFFAPVLVGLMGRFMLHDAYGVYAYFLKGIGLWSRGGVFTIGSSALVSLILMDVWEWTPLVFLIGLAGIKAQPAEPFEAASIDGANAWQKLVYLMIPMLKPYIFVALVIRTMDIMRYFSVILVVTGGGPADATKTIAIGVHDQAFRFFNLGYASTLGMAMLIITIMLGNVFLKFFVKAGPE